MEIENPRKSLPTTGSLTAKEDQGAERTAERSEPSAGEAAATVHLSPRAREYQRARQALAAINDVDKGKVRAIKDRINSGCYRIDADQIADKMIRQTASDGD